MLWLGLFVPLFVIGAAAGGYYLMTSSPGQAQTPDEPQADTIPLGTDVYLLVKTIELFPNRPDGEQWDRVGDSGPDIDYKLVWQGNTVFEAKQKNDTLIASWDALAIDIRSAVISGQLDLGSSIDAALVRVEAGSVVTLKVWDNDVTGTDDAGELPIQLDELVFGDNKAAFDLADDNAIKRIVLRVIDRSLPVSELVEEATRP